MKHIALIIGMLVMMTTAAQAEITRLQITPNTPGNSVRFTSDAPMELIQGETRHVQGTITVDAAKLADPTTLKDIKFSVDLASLDTGIGLRNQHMRDSYLETGKYPKATFQVQKLTPMFKGPVKPGQVLVYKATGPFTLHGKTLEKTIPVSVINGDKSVRIQSQFPVALADFGIPRPEMVMQKLSDNIYVNLDVKVVRPAVKTASAAKTTKK